MPVAFVQEADAASSSVTLGANATAGNTLVVAVACLGPASSTGVTGVTLGGSADNFALVTPGPSARDTTSPNDYLNVSVWADANCAGGSTAIVVTGTGVLAVWAYEFSGLAGTPENWQVTPVATYQDSWITSLPATVAPAQAWLAITATANQTATETLTVNNVTGWTLETARNGTLSSYFWGGVSAYQTVNSTGTPAWSGSFSQPSFSVTVLVTFPVAPLSAPAAPAPAATSIAAGVTASGGSLNVTANVNAGQVTAGSPAAQATAPVGLTPTGVKTGSYTARPGDFVPVFAAKTISVTITLPPAPPTGSMVGVQVVNAATPSFGAQPNSVTVQTSGSDVFGAQPPGTTQVFLNTIGATFIAQYRAAVATWYIESAGYAEPALGSAVTAPLASFPVTPPANSPLPADLGFITWSYDPAYQSTPLSGTALTSGKVYLVLCPVRATTYVSTVAAWITGAGSGLTANQNFVGVYSSTGTLLFTSPDVTAAFGSTGGFFGGLVSGSAAQVSPPYVWAAFLSNGTTPPSFARTVNTAGILANGALATNAPRFGTLVASHTSLPASFSVVGGDATSASAAYWVALY